MFLLDPNALAEPGRPRPDPGFMRWCAGLGLSDFRLSAISLGELRRRMALLAPSPRRRELEGLYANIAHRFAAQVLAVDAAVAEAWGDLSARLRRSRLVIGAPDELIAATALAHGLTLVTRNLRHFKESGCDLISPWSG